MQQHPLFIKYRRDWLHEVTGYSKGYLCRVATGNTPLSRSFIERVCSGLTNSSWIYSCLTLLKATAHLPGNNFRLWDGVFKGSVNSFWRK